MISRFHPFQKLHLWGNVGFRHLNHIFDVSVSMPGLDEDIVLRVVADENSVAPRGTTSLHISEKNHKQLLKTECEPPMPLRCTVCIWSSTFDHCPQTEGPPHMGRLVGIPMETLSNDFARWGFPCRTSSSAASSRWTLYDCIQIWENIHHHHDLN